MTSEPSPTAPQVLSPPLQTDLLQLARSICGQLDITSLVARLPPAATALPGLAACALGVCDDERDLYTTHVFFPPPNSDPTAACTILHDPLDHSAANLLRTATAAITLDAPLPGDRPPWLQRLPAAEDTHWLLVPLRLQQRLLGGLLAGFDAHAEPDSQAPAFLAALAALITPVLWNCHTHARFQLGDRRRETLIELSNAINTSLERPTVLASARQAIQRLGGHPVSALNLADEALTSYHAYSSATHGTPQANIHPIAGSVLAWILAHGCTYESDDLAQRTAFAHDPDLRAAGVRRYVAAPMFVRGRISGCLLMCSAEPHRTLRVDVWLYENIALQLALAIDNARQLEQVQALSDRLAQQNVYLREEIKGEHNFGEMIGDSPALSRVRASIARVAPTDTTVLILGETGVGKELVARAIHAAGSRAAHPMVKVNCSAIPAGMVESELFGHERGAFTSAVERRIGRFELARDGTLFLDEVAELPLPLQAKLLRVLQDGEFERVGGSETLKSDARIIAATNRDLTRAVEAGTFRADLYYRLNVFPLEVPPLRARLEDVPALVAAFVSQFNRRMGKRVTTIDADSLDRLSLLPWPGNIRELRHVVERAMIFCDTSTLRIESRVAGPTDTTPQRSNPAAPPASTLSHVEANHIRQVLKQTGYVIEGPRGAAAILGLKPSTLRFRMTRLGITRPQ